jgi:hypothetical protein
MPHQGPTRRWLVPAVCLAACGYLAVFLAAGKVGMAIACGAIMLAYGGMQFPQQCLQ